MVALADLEKLDIRVGTIRAVVDVPGSRKLAKLTGEVSEGMLFDIGYEDGIVPVLAVPERPVPDGTRAG
jgi:tRNA-binding EMAP/Myf-like protein